MILPILTAIVFVTTIASCLSDLRAMRIPNLHVLIIIGAFILAYLLSPESFGRWWEPMASFIIVFVVTYIMFAVGMIGGGDAKLAAALALWTGLPGLAAYMFYMAIMGGVLGVLALVIRKRKTIFKSPEGSWISEVQSGKNAVPYGIAITFGAWMALLYTGFIHQILDELITIIH